MPKLWIALFFGYNGKPFSGMQFQIEEHVVTVEGTLISKLYQAGFLSTNHHGQLQRTERWSRSARTDKGVHAAINGISCQMIIDSRMFNQDKTLNRNMLHLQLKQLLEGTNIVYHCFKRVTTRFQIRHMIKSRHYSYICPKSIFNFELLNCKKNQQNPIKSVQKQQLHQQEGQSGCGVKQQRSHLEDNSQNLSNITIKKQEILLKKLNQCCQQFVGTHNFHNYSKNLKAKDPTAQRYILNFGVKFLDDNFIIFDVIGQSFIYHQIRKMIGCIIMIMINNYEPSYITNTFFRNQIHMPLAPAQGLYLNALCFDGYNRKHQIPEKLQFDQFQSISKLKQSIWDYIKSQDSSIWENWITKLKESIYHGIDLVQDDADNVQINDQ